MHIMLTNDDGIRALGIRTLARVLSDAGHKVSVCAPDRERSAASHSITLRRALTAEKVEFPCAEIAYAADGTPADCARLGLYLIPNVDLVISGINNGSNLGGACVYSGTVGAAMEAAMSGMPALATSLGAFDQTDYVPAARVTLKVAEWMMDHPLGRGEFYNLNVPAVPYDQIQGVIAAPLAPNYLDSAAYTPTEDGKFMYTHGVNVPFEDPECDVLRMKEGFAPLTKLTWDLRLNAPHPDAAEINL